MSTRIERATLSDCHLARDTVVVIDVLRAFTTAAFAFAAGAKEIVLVSTIGEAFALKEVFPQALLVGEERGLPIEGFDFGNSPSELKTEDLSGKRLIQRTSTGTQGVVKSRRAERVLVTGLCNVSATVAYLKQHQIQTLTLVEAGVHDDKSGLDDSACGDFIEALLQGKDTNQDAIRHRVLESPAAAKFLDTSLGAFPLADLEFAVQIDRFDFAMKVTWQNERAHLHRV